MMPEYIKIDVRSSKITCFEVRTSIITVLAQQLGNYLSKFRMPRPIIEYELFFWGAHLVKYIELSNSLPNV